MLKIDRQGFLALALGMNLGACYTNPPPSNMGPGGGGYGQPMQTAPTSEASYAPSQECVGWTPAGECSQWAPRHEGHGMAPVAECIGWTPAGECNQWDQGGGGMAPANECIGWTPTGECNRWEPRRER
jgi:hypothetical protein